MTVYLWGILNRQFELRGIYTMTDRYLRDWFPKLPSYQAFCRRVNDLNYAFGILADMWMDAAADEMSSAADEMPSAAFVLDSCPIILAKNSRSDNAKVARELCRKTYNSSRKEWYYGVKLHVLGMLRSHKLPLPKAMLISPASASDLATARQMISDTMPFSNAVLFADKVYVDAAWKAMLARDYGIHLRTPRKKLKGIPDVLPSGDAYSSFVSSRRQPIEAFFHWLNDTTHIQLASKVRSFKGLLAHVFSRIAAAFFSISYP